MWDFIRQLVARSSVLKTGRAQKAFLIVVGRSFADAAAVKPGPRLAPFQRGQIVGMSKVGAKAKKIADLVRKKNKRRPSLQAVYDVLVSNITFWQAGRRSGRHRATTLAGDGPATVLTRC